MPGRGRRSYFSYEAETHPQIVCNKTLPWDAFNVYGRRYKLTGGGSSQHKIP